ncbi:M48 family metalloprotease [Yinghuangia soli]|uniref:M48 family metalloprotease n=1 Tax=Yinghuangia soli TaxID=2908204 RepID=A0AA41Q7F4_9ACTN|nr:M48 family metalloprotease [Yinghuangia soli]MCF2532627.1 M48 family metalloprotease [Yinghuangia soli]
MALADEEKPPTYPGLPPAASFGTRPELDDLALASGRRHLKARQRGADKAALLRILVALPAALVSLLVVVAAFALISIGLAGLMGLTWLASGALAFHRPSEAFIARRILGMRRPNPAESRRLADVWAEVTRRAGVRQETYELWIQERADLDVTATAGHVVGVTAYAMDHLPNSRLAAVLAHELGHHVGGHSWAATLADWYALPARKTGRWLLRGLTKLVRSTSPRALLLTAGLLLVLGVFGYVLAIALHMWWLVLMLAITPPLTSWLHRRAEYRADDFAAGLGFGPELTAVLTDEHDPSNSDPLHAARLRHLHRTIGPGL